MPLRAWAEALGERVMPAYEAVKEEGKAAKASAVRGAAPPPKMQAPAVPHFLPFTRWCAPCAPSLAYPRTLAECVLGSVLADFAPTEPREYVL